MTRHNGQSHGLPKHEDAAQKHLGQNLGYCNKFVNAVATDPNINVHFLEGKTADEIMDELRRRSANPRNGIEALGPSPRLAKERADAGYLVIGGLKGAELKQPEDHGHVVLVVTGDLDPVNHKYPRAYWGSLGKDRQGCHPTR